MVIRRPYHRAILILICTVIFALPMTRVALAKSKAGIPSPKVIKKLMKKVQSLTDDDGDPFFKLEGKSYTIHCYVTKTMTVELSLFMDAYHNAFMSRFSKDKFRVKERPLYAVYKGQDQFMSKGQIDNKMILGFFRPSDKVLRAYVKEGNEDKPLYHRDNTQLRQTSQHEGTHQLLYWILGTSEIPFWFNEGTADLFGSWNVARPMTLNRNSSFIDNIHISLVWEKIRKGELVDIRYITNLEGASKFQNGPVIYHYGSSYALISFMLSERTGLVGHFNDQWRDIKKGQTKLYEKFFNKKYLKKSKIQRYFNKFLMEWYSFSYVRFSGPWRAPAGKLLYLAETWQEQLKTKDKAYVQACKDVIKDFTDGMTFETPEAVLAWEKENHDYLEYVVDRKDIVNYKKPAMDVDPFYYEYATFGQLGGLYGHVEINKKAKLNGIPHFYWELLEKTEVADLNKASDEEKPAKIKELLAIGKERFQKEQKKREPMIKGLQAAYKRLVGE